MRPKANGEHNRVVKETVAGVELPLRIQDEVACRHCDVHCEKVVYPAACLRMACPFVNAYEAWGHTYVGCMQMIYDVAPGEAPSEPIGLDARRGRAPRPLDRGA